MAKIYAIIPARSGSKGLHDKNIKLLDGRELISYSINFARALNVDKVICSTDSPSYADVAEKFGAEVPFLRSDKASSDTAMEQDILEDLYEKFSNHGIDYPDYFIWLRPTFVFRDLREVQRGIRILEENENITAVRTVCPSEGRLYALDEQILSPNFDDGGKSMIRRQDVGDFYKVYSTDIFRGKPKNVSDDFLGRNVMGIPINKICGLDIDDLIDFSIVEALLKHRKDLVERYLY